MERIYSLGIINWKTVKRPGNTKHAEFLLTGGSDGAEWQIRINLGSMAAVWIIVMGWDGECRKTSSIMGS